MQYVTDETARRTLRGLLAEIEETTARRSDVQALEERLGARQDGLDEDRARLKNRAADLVEGTRSLDDFKKHRPEVDDLNRRIGEIGRDIEGLKRERKVCREEAQALRERAEVLWRDFWRVYGDALLSEFRQHAEALALRFLYPLRTIGAKGHGAARLSAGAVDGLAWWEDGNVKRTVWPAYDTRSIGGEQVDEADLAAALIADLQPAAVDA